MSSWRSAKFYVARTTWRKRSNSEGKRHTETARCTRFMAAGVKHAADGNWLARASTALRGKSEQRRPSPMAEAADLNPAQCEFDPRGRYGALFQTGRETPLKKEPVWVRAPGVRHGRCQSSSIGLVLRTRLSSPGQNELNGSLAQLEEASGSSPEQSGSESLEIYSGRITIKEMGLPAKECVATVMGIVRSFFRVISLRSPMAEASGLGPDQCTFDSCRKYVVTKRNVGYWRPACFGSKIKHVRFVSFRRCINAMQCAARL